MEKTEEKKDLPAQQETTPAVPPTQPAPPAKGVRTKQVTPAKPPETQMKAPKKKRKWVKRLIALVLLVAVVALVFTQCTGKSGSGIAVGAYLSSPVATQELLVSVSGTGTIEPINSYKVTTLIKGEVVEAPFEEGATVNKGDLLFRIDSSDLENSIQQSRLSLESAQVNYNKLLKDQADNKKDSTVRATEAGVVTKLYVDQGDNVMANTVIADILDRDHMKLVVPFHAADAAGFSVGQQAAVTVDGTMETIYGSIDTIAATDSVGAGGTITRNVTILVTNPGVLTETSYGTAVINSAACAESKAFAFGASKQVVAKTSGELKTLSIKEGDRVYKDQVIGAFDQTSMDAQLQNASIQIETAQLSLKNAQDKLEDYAITSTITGTVIEKNVDVGDNIDGTSSSATSTANPAVIYDLSALTFDIKIDELDINKIKVGQAVEITADALNGKSFTGRVDKVNINGTTQNGVTTYPITVLVDNPEELLPGMNVSAKIIVERAGQVLCIPVDYVGRGNVVLVAGTGVLDDKGNVINVAAIETRSVTLGRNSAEYIEILDGLSEGETVLVENSASNAMSMMMGG